MHWPIYNEAGHCLPRDKILPVFGSAICKLLYRDGLLGKSSSSTNTCWAATGGGCVTDAVITALSCVQGTVTDGGSRQAQQKYEMRRKACPKSAFAAGSPGLLRVLTGQRRILPSCVLGGGEQGNRIIGLAAYGRRCRASLVYMCVQDNDRLYRLTFDKSSDERQSIPRVKCGQLTLLLG